jgi:hypothetical protein
MRVMRKFMLAIIVAFLACGSFSTLKAQDNASNQEIAGLVSQLSWDSVGGECRFYWHIFPTGEAAKKLLKIGKPATDELLKVLEDESKGVAAHLILSQIWEPKNISWENRIEGDDFVHVYNGLKWADVLKKRSVKRRVNKVDLVKNAEEWRRKVASYRGSTEQRRRA